MIRKTKKMITNQQWSSRSCQTAKVKTDRKVTMLGTEGNKVKHVWQKCFFVVTKQRGAYDNQN